MPNALIAYLNLFKTIPAADQQLIDEALELRAFKEGDTLFQSGKICREFFFICNGVLRIITVNDKGHEVIHFFLKENQFCTILNSFTNQVPSGESIQAASATEVLVISRTKLIQLFDLLPYLKELIDRITQQALMDKIQLRHMYQGQDSTARYKLFLMQQSDIALRVSLNDVASYLGITPQSLSRIRRNLLS